MDKDIKFPAIGLAAMLSIFVFTACSQKPSSEEIAAQVKIAMEQAEKDKQAAAEPVEAPPPTSVNKETTSPATVKPKSVVQASKVAKQPAEILRPVCANCGVVLAVNVIEEDGKGSGVGVVAGGVVGGLLGNQVGGGTGRDIATIAGAVGGAIAGNKIEKHVKKTKSYDIVVKMDNGQERTYRQATDPGMTGGQKVKIENDVVVKD